MHFTKKIGFLFSYSLPILILVSYYFGTGFWAYATVWYGYLLIPVIDLLMNRDSQNVLKEEVESLTQDWYFDVLVYSHIWIQIFLLIWGSFVLAIDVTSFNKAIALILSQGVYSATIINVAHELGHRPSKIAQFHARLGLISLNYSHFTIEHNKGHHLHVATPLDPATAKKNQTVYAFWLQTIFGGLKSAWKFEVRRLEKLGKSKWSFGNDILSGYLFSFTLFLSVFLFFSLILGRPAWLILLFLVFQSIIGFLSLECVNYIEHYGILRKQNAEGRYERVNPLHSWNSNHAYSNLVLFQLQRHSDHHANATRPYQTLRHMEDSPQLPFGYPLMIIISLFPKLWFKYMNPVLEGWENKTYTQQSIS
jgi:alkane 1-monooxygenase